MRCGGGSRTDELLKDAPRGASSQEDASQEDALGGRRWRVRWQMDGLPPGSEVSLRLGGIAPARMVFWWLLLPFFVLSLGAVVYALRRRKQDG